MLHLKKFLDYTGRIDYKIIDQLLLNLKNNREYTNLDKTTAKRVYAIVVECLENIVKHSVTLPHADRVTLPTISAGKAGDKVIIKAGNPISDNSREKVEAALNLVNELDGASLASLYEDKMDGKSRPNDNGARLGFILMRLKSGNKIDFSFTNIDDSHLHFDMQISVNKYHEKVNY